MTPEGEEATGGRVIAVGGQRTVPEPDPIAAEYLLLALRLDQHAPGLVDGYFGPADIKARVDMEQRRSPARLREDAERLRGRIEGDVEDPRRRRWLGAQLVALETQARSLAGDPLPYLDHVTRCFDLVPERTPESRFELAVSELDRLLPGEGPLPQRIAAWDSEFTIAPDRLSGVVESLVSVFRARARERFGLPDGESLTVSLVTGQPWTGYNWYDGGLRSRVDLNTDLPVRAADLLTTLPHETYPGHHLEHAWKEARLVEQERRLEHAVLLINTPECVVSEGLADLGRRFAVPPDAEVDLLVDVYERAGLPIAKDRVRARDAARRQQEISRAMQAVRGVRGNAALMLHADGIPRHEVVAYLRRWMLEAPERAEKRIEFIEHPLWRTYVFVYFEGERLLRRWLEEGGEDETSQVARFGRLLREAPTPSSIAEELAAASA